MFRILSWLVAGCLLIPLTAQAGQESITLSNDIEIPVYRFGSESDRLLWLPSEFGMCGEREMVLGAGLADKGFDVWIVDLHEAYFLLPGRNSLREMPITDIAELIELSQPESGRLFLMSTGRGAALTLMAVRQWQQTYPERKTWVGCFCFTPIC